MSILKEPYLLHGDPITLLAPTNHPRIKCKKTQLKNLSESIRDEDVPYLIVVENITAKETRVMFKAFAMLFPAKLRVTVGGELRFMTLCLDS